MTKLTLARAQVEWSLARDEEIGRAIPCNPAERRAVQSRLYKARTEMDDPALHENFAVVMPGDRDEVWIVRRQKEGME